MRIVNSAILLISLIFVSAKSYAEYCWMIGCRGAIAYIYVPRSQIDVTPNTKISVLNDVTYSLDISKKLFKEFGLPRIDSVVTLNVHLTPFVDESDIRRPEILKKVEEWPYIYDKDKRTARVKEYEIKGGSPMRMKPGARVRILGYTNVGHSAWGESKLFALVMVEDDG